MILGRPTVTFVANMLMCVTLAMAQTPAPIEYDAITGLPIVDIDTIAVLTERRSIEQTDNADYDPLTGLPIAEAAVVIPKKAKPKPITVNHLKLSQMGRQSARAAFDQGNWRYIIPMTAAGGAYTGGIWTAMATGSVMFTLIGGIVGGNISTAFIGTGTEPLLSDKIGAMSRYEQQVYRSSYDTEFRKMRKKQTRLGLAIAAATGFILAINF